VFLTDFTCATCLKGYILLMTWRVEFLNEGVLAELDALPKDIQARFLRISRLPLRAVLGICQAVKLREQFTHERAESGGPARSRTLGPPVH
jgi:hypothetical protein